MKREVKTPTCGMALVITKKKADGRIRTGNLLITNQLLCR